MLLGQTKHSETEAPKIIFERPETPRQLVVTEYNLAAFHPKDQSEENGKKIIEELDKQGYDCTRQDTDQGFFFTVGFTVSEEEIMKLKGGDESICEHVAIL